MTAPAIDWDRVELVVFDVDGTLYDQRAMRLRMAMELAQDTLRRRDLTAAKVLRLYRRFRERIGETETEGFEPLLIGQVAAATGVEAESIRSIVREWLERRPLAHIRDCRYPHMVELFAAIRRKGKLIGVFSDYPAVEKLQAMELPFDYVVSAIDDAVGILKPHPRGLTLIMERAGVEAGNTVFIGDRPERDGVAALRASVLPLIRSKKPLDGWHTFASYSDRVFAQLFSQSPEQT